MRPDALLTGAAVAAVLVVVALAAVVPGFVAEPSTGPEEPPARLDVAEMTLSAGEVTAETATLETTAYVHHRGGSAENVTVVTRATSTDSGLVVDTSSTELGDIDNENERDVPSAVTVPREGGYDVTTILYLNGSRIDTATATVSGVAALTPPHAESSVEFHRFRRQPSLEYTIESVDDGRATLSVSSYLTNRGDDPESDLRLVVIARQSDANVVAAREERSVGSIASGRTVTPDVRLTVPDENNYYLDATLWRDGVILESTRAVANLDPERSLAVNETVRDVQFRAGEFETGGGGASEEPSADSATAEPDSEGQSGFGAVVAVVALTATLLATRRWSA